MRFGEGELGDAKEARVATGAWDGDNEYYDDSAATSGVELRS